jgi:transposase
MVAPLLVDGVRFPRFCGLGCDKGSTAMNRNRSGRRYDREFKNNAVALVRGGRTITEVARDLGVSKWSLGHWVRQAEEGQLLSEPKTLALETPEERELRRLRQELEYVSRERDILSLNRSTCFLSVAPAKSLFTHLHS